MNTHCLNKTQGSVLRNFFTSKIVLCCLISLEEWCIFKDDEEVIYRQSVDNGMSTCLFSPGNGGRSRFGLSVLSGCFSLFLPPVNAGRYCFQSCLSVPQSFCLSICLSVQAITFEPLHMETSFLLWRYILTISRSSLSIKVIGSKSRSCTKMIVYLLQLVIPLYVATGH